MKATGCAASRREVPDGRREASPSAELVVERVPRPGSARLADEADELAVICCSVPVRAPAAWKIVSRMTVPCTSFAPK